MNRDEFLHQLSHSITKKPPFQRWAWDSAAQRDCTVGNFEVATLLQRREMCRRFILSRCQIESRSALRIDPLAREEFELILVEFNRDTDCAHQEGKVDQ